jgi:hypothetical protein
MRVLSTTMLFAVVAGAMPASAQTDPKCAQGPQLAPRAESDAKQRDPQMTGQGGQNLSEQLARSGSVICPPASVDPEMKVPTPETGRTPVIPPPGSPGGDQSVQPK